MKDVISVDTTGEAEEQNNSSQSNSKSEDTSLDDIFDNHGQIVGYGDYYQTETLADIKIEIMAWHKAEIAKLFEQIRKLKEDYVEFHNDGSDKWETYVEAVPLEALTRLEQK